MSTNPHLIKFSIVHDEITFIIIVIDVEFWGGGNLVEFYIDESMRLAEVHRIRHTLSIGDIFDSLAICIDVVG